MVVNYIIKFDQIPERKVAITFQKRGVEEEVFCFLLDNGSINLCIYLKQVSLIQ